MIKVSEIRAFADGAVDIDAHQLRGAAVFGEREHRPPGARPLDKYGEPRHQQRADDERHDRGIGDCDPPDLKPGLSSETDCNVHVFGSGAERHLRDALQEIADAYCSNKYRQRTRASERSVGERLYCHTQDSTNDHSKQNRKHGRKSQVR